MPSFQSKSFHFLKTTGLQKSDFTARLARRETIPAGANNDAEMPGPGGSTRARSHCRFVPPRIHFPPGSLPYSVLLKVLLFLNKSCDRTLGSTWPTLARMREDVQAVVRLLQKRGDQYIHYRDGLDRRGP
jgi:hypothetical protein